MEASTNPDVKPNNNGKPSTKQKPTEYVILEVEESGPDIVGGPTLKVFGGITGGKPKTFPGVSKQAALKEANTGSGKFILVPARTFVTVNLELVEQRPVEKFEEASF